MAFQFGTNSSELSRRAGSIQGPLLGYESFTAFALEAAFFGVLMFGRNKVPRWFYLMSCFMVAAGTSLSSFWIMVSNQRTVCDRDVRIVPHDRLINVGDPFNRIMLNTCLWSW